MEFDLVGVNKSASASHSLKTLVRVLFKLSRSLCPNLKATRIDFVVTINFLCYSHIVCLEFNMLGVKKSV